MAGLVATEFGSREVVGGSIGSIGCHVVPGSSTRGGASKGLSTAPVANAAPNEAPVAMPMIAIVRRVIEFSGATCRREVLRIGDRAARERRDDRCGVCQLVVLARAASRSKDLMQRGERRRIVEARGDTREQPLGIVETDDFGLIGSTFVGHEATVAPESVRWVARRRSARCWVTRTHPADRFMIAPT